MSEKPPSIVQLTNKPLINAPTYTLPVFLKKYVDTVAMIAKVIGTAQKNAYINL